MTQNFHDRTSAALVADSAGYTAPPNQPIILMTDRGPVLVHGSQLRSVSSPQMPSGAATCSTCSASGGGAGLPGGLKSIHVFVAPVVQLGFGFFSRALGGLRVLIGPPNR
jgi:hypothetical protein